MEQPLHMTTKYYVFYYGVILAGLALLLSMAGYFHFVRAYPSEIYIVLVALLFTGVGIWAGRRLTSPPRAKPFRTNEKARDYLGITEREMEVLRLIEEGYSNRQIAERLYISIHTVKTHVSSLLSKLDCNRRTQVVRKAKLLKLIP